MFTREDNELLTRVAPGTPMGALLREYWPMDDERTFVLEWRFRPARSFSEAERAELVRLRAPHGFLPKTSRAAGAFMPRAHAENDYFLDRSLETRALREAPR